MSTIDYRIELDWTGDRGSGTSDYRAYARDHTVRAEGRPPLELSSDPKFRGDRSKYNPEELLLASLSGCHMLWYLHLAAEAHVVVIGYRDRPSATLELGPDGGGRFRQVTLRPEVRIRSGDPEVALALHDAARARCFISNSVNFPVDHVPRVRREGEPEADDVAPAHVA